MSSCGIFVIDNKNSVPLRIEFMNIVISKTGSKQVGIFLDGIVGSSDPEVLIDQISDLSSAKERVLLLGFLFLQTDSSFQVRIVDDFVQR